MDSPSKTYQQISNDLHEVNRENIIIDQPQMQPPPAYNGNYQQQQIGGAPQPSMVTGTSNVGALPPGMPIIPLQVGPNPSEMTCPHCRCRIRTRITHRSTSKTHIACLLLSCTLCCCLPYCMDSCRNANHFCPMCGAFIGTYAS